MAVFHIFQTLLKKYFGSIENYFIILHYQFDSR
jgi:hypothetical protein